MEFGMRFRRADAHERKGARSWHDIECAPLAEVRKVQEAKLVRQMEWLGRRSAFYQRKFAEAGVAFKVIRSIEDLQKLPFTLKTEIRESLSAERPFGTHLAADLSDVVQMQASSGTTGSPSYVALTESDAEMWHEMSARCFFAGGIRPGDIVLHAFSMAKGFVGGVPIVQGLQYMGAIDVPIGADGGADRLLRAAADLRPRCVLGAPNFVAYLAEKAPELIGMKASELGVERVIVGGEPGGGIPAIRSRIEGLWGAKCCELLGGTDIGMAYWSECDGQSGMHMVALDHVIVELLDTDTGAIIPFQTGVRGELIYTAISRQASPLVRFRSGDHVEVLGTSCACGRSGPKIRCVGRTDDMLIVRGVNVFPSAVREIVARYQPRVTGALQIRPRRRGVKQEPPLPILVEGDPEVAESIAKEIRGALTFAPEIRMVPRQSLPRSDYKSKLVDFSEAGKE